MKKLVSKHHCLGEWLYINKAWEAKEDYLQLHGWTHARRVAIVRRRVSSDAIIGLEYEKEGPQSLAFIDGPEELRAYEYSVLVTDLDDDLITLFHHYRDRADCENNFDEMKNQWGWGGYTTRQLKSCQLILKSSVGHAEVCVCSGVGQGATPQNSLLFQGVATQRYVTTDVQFSV